MSEKQFEIKIDDMDSTIINITRNGEDFAWFLSDDITDKQVKKVVDLLNSLTNENSYLKRRIGASQNTTGFYRVHLIKRKGVYKDSVRYGYTYFDENHVRRLISASTLAELERKVRSRKLDWFIIDEKKANELLMKNV